MTRQGGLGRGLASLIPSSKKQNYPKQQDSLNNDRDFFVDSSQKIDKKNSTLESKKKLDDDLGYFSGAEESSKNQSENIHLGDKVFPKESLNFKKEEIIDVRNENKKEPKKDEKNNVIFQDKISMIREVPLDSIIPNPFQPRKNFNLEKLQELADSIRQHGIIQPLVVSTVSSRELNENQLEERFELISGERRLRAGKIAGLKKIPIVIRNSDSDRKKAELALIENVQRHDLNPVEEARAYHRLKEQFGLIQEEIANRVAKSRSRIANAIRLLNLPEDILKELEVGALTEGHARALLSIENVDHQRMIFRLIVEENLSVREAEKQARKFLSGDLVRSYQNKKVSNWELEGRANEISAKIGAKVKIKKSRLKSQIVIDFYSEEEFESLLERLSKNE